MRVSGLIRNQNIVIIEGESSYEFEISNIANKPQEYITESDVSWVDIGINHYRWYIFNICHAGCC